MRAEQLAEQVVVVRDALSPQECQTLIERAEGLGFEEAAITTESGPQLVKRIRNNDRVFLDDTELAGVLWQRLGAHAPRVLYGYEAVELNERFRFYRYHPGQFFRWHMDGYFERENGDRSQYTLMVYLNDAFEGGVTEFHDCRIEPEVGMATLFYHHQKHCGGTVKTGVKYVLRTDVMYRRLPEGTSEAHRP